MRKILFVITGILFLFISCGDKEKLGTIQLHFQHNVGLEAVQLNTLTYTNAAQNLYQVNEVKYFISKVFFITKDDKMVKVSQDEGIHYVDLNYPNTTTWELKDIDATEYKAVQFVFGLDEEDNISNKFPNAPECNFFWPQHLGGGYHYMQINGKWQPPTGDLRNFNFHAGMGQLYYSNVLSVDSIYGFVHNYIALTLPVSFVVEEDDETHLEMQMDISQWFKDPYVYDHNFFGSSIMQNQNAQSIIKANGRDVFKFVTLHEE